MGAVSVWPSVPVGNRLLSVAALSPGSGAKPATKTSALTLVAPFAAALITWPP
jgi:hypothetical protein